MTVSDVYMFFIRLVTVTVATDTMAKTAQISHFLWKTIRMMCSALMELARGSTAVNRCRTATLLFGLSIQADISNPSAKILDGMIVL